MLKKDVIKLIEKLKNEPKHKTFAETISLLYKDKYVEIYFGDVSEQLTLADFSRNIYNVVCGKVIDAYGDMLILDCAFIDDNGETKMQDNMVIVNGFNIKAITELDGTGQLKDVFMNTITSSKIRKLNG